MYKNELKGLSLSDLKRLLKILERGRNAAQASLDTLEKSSNKVNATTKKELRKSLRFYERSTDKAFEVLAEKEVQESRVAMDKKREAMRKKYRRR
jgi:hypothetical protein